MMTLTGGNPWTHPAWLWLQQLLAIVLYYWRSYQLSLSHSVSLSVSIALCFSLCLYRSLFLSLSLLLSLSVSLSLSLSVSLSLSLFLSLSLALFLSLSVSISLSLSLSVCLSLSLFLSVSLPFLLQFNGCLTSQQHASVSQGQISSDNFTCCNTCRSNSLTRPQYTDTRPTSPSADPATSGAWHCGH